jgi:hypothetical protein
MGSVMALAVLAVVTAAPGAEPPRGALRIGGRLQPPQLPPPQRTPPRSLHAVGRPVGHGAAQGSAQGSGLRRLASDTATACTGSSTKLPALQCAAWIKFYDALKGDGWTYCQGKRSDPCACKGTPSFGNPPVCNPAGTTVVTVCVRPHPSALPSAAACACRQHRYYFLTATPPPDPRPTPCPPRLRTRATPPTAGCPTRTSLALSPRRSAHGSIW